MTIRKKPTMTSTTNTQLWQAVPSAFGYVSEPVHRVHRVPATSAQSRTSPLPRHRPSFRVWLLLLALHRSEWTHTAHPSGHGKHSPSERKLPSAHAVHPVGVISRQCVASAMLTHPW